MAAVSQSLADDAPQRASRALRIVNSKLHAVRISEIELCKIAVQMLFKTKLINAFHTALENAEEILDGVRLHVAADLFVRFVTDALMAREMIA